VCDLETSRMGAPYIYIYIYIYDISRLRVKWGRFECRREMFNEFSKVFVLVTKSVLSINRNP